MNNFETKVMFSRKLLNNIQYKICGYQVIDKKAYPIIAASNGEEDIIITHEQNQGIIYSEISKVSFEILASIHIGKFFNGEINASQPCYAIFDYRDGRLVERSFDALQKKVAVRGQNIFFNVLKEYYNEILIDIYEDPISNLSWKDPRENPKNNNSLKEILD